jgi:3-methyladenine DNA glycosylase AlkD
MYKSQIDTIQSLLQGNADPNVKDWWEGYVKQSAPFRGVKMPLIRSLLHQWHRHSVKNRLDTEQQIVLALELIRQKYTEDKLAGIIFLQEILLPAGAIQCEREIDRFAELFRAGSINDWNVCDWFCVKVLGPMIQDEGKRCASLISEWRSAENLWQARASLVAFVKVAKDSSFYPMVQKSCMALIKREERFAKTAVGWILRDISKYDESFVKSTVEKNIMNFSVESLKNATKYLNPKDKKMYLQMLNDD